MLTKFKGFTLSEVLISLVIIGVIAAITLQILFANYQEQAIKSSLKKNYSALKQALEKYYIENGEKIYKADLKSQQLKKYIMPYMNVMKDCGYGYVDKETACFSTTNNSDNYKNYNGTNTINSLYFDDGQFILLDGSLILVNNGGGTDTQRTYISVDVNGFDKKPNRLGKDLFMFYLTDDGDFLPMGANGTPYSVDKYCSSTSSHNMNGAGCTYKMLKN